MSKRRGQIQNGREDGVISEKLSALQGSNGGLLVVNGAGVVSAKRRRSPIPDRDPTIRRWVSEMLPTLGYEATAADIAALIRWCRGFRTWRRLDERLEENGVAKADGDPTKWLQEWRAQSEGLSRLEAQLGLTASARASLGLDVSRMRRLSQGNGGARADEGSVIELEQRVLARLGVGAGDSAGTDETDEGAPDG